MEGYIVIDRATAYISEEATIGNGTVIKPNTTIEGKTIIGDNCVIGPNSIITDTVIRDNCIVLMSVVNGAVIGSGTNVGPFAYLRPEAVIGENCKIGHCVEIKKSNVGDETKILHLSYVGDANIGKNVNVGCGSITANYNGKTKERCVIGDDAFIGCNTNLIAPVTVGKNAQTAAGSTINENVPDNAMGIARCRQSVIENWETRNEKRTEN
jgi:bifunctional UDP-N-acetylglucosamine pyrophosphorylase/glucosamine-1-phosphate N-acetyltransferase